MTAHHIVFLNSRTQQRYAKRAAWSLNSARLGSCEFSYRIDSFCVLLRENSELRNPTFPCRQSQHEWSCLWIQYLRWKGITLIDIYNNKISQGYIESVPSFHDIIALLLSPAGMFPPDGSMLPAYCSKHFTKQCYLVHDLSHPIPSPSLRFQWW